AAPAGGRQPGRQVSPNSPGFGDLTLRLPPARTRPSDPQVASPSSSAAAATPDHGHTSRSSGACRHRVNSNPPDGTPLCNSDDEQESDARCASRHIWAFGGPAWSGRGLPLNALTLIYAHARRTRG